MIRSARPSSCGPSHGQVRGLRGSSFYRVVSFFPYVIPAIVIAILWNMIYTPSGLLNGLLGLVGIDTNQFAWLGDERTAMGATIFVIVWSMVGFYMVLFIAAIKGIRQRTWRECADRVAKLAGVCQGSDLDVGGHIDIRAAVRCSAVFGVGALVGGSYVAVAQHTVLRTPYASELCPWWRA